jgi:hypothetical protein
MSDHQQNQAESVIACNPKAIAPDQRSDHEALARDIFSPTSVLEIRELTDGYRFRLPLETPLLHKVTAFVANERLCCPFYIFTLEIGEQFWFELTGTPEVKAYLKAELIAALETNKFPTFAELEVAYEAATDSTGGG